ncbi:MAG: hypothetical protein U0R19_13220 [Bryobacteraceae bacterium]
MPEAHYQGLASDGLPLVTPSDEAFATRLRSIRDNCWFPVPEVHDEPAAILVNLTGQTILAFAIVWRYTDPAGESRTHRISTLSSSRQIEALCGRAGVGPDDHTFVLPGSQRLITQQGIYGDNHDVIPPEVRRRSGFGGGGSAGGTAPGGFNRIELSLDVVFLEDGRVLGPDTSDLFRGMVSTFAAQRQLAWEMIAALRRGATVGACFDLLRPLGLADRSQHDGLHSLRHMFLHRATHVLLHLPEDEILAWAEREAEPPRLHLHRALT